ncbi:CUB domain protein, partial [Ancylostoma duodenale]
KAGRQLCKDKKCGFEITLRVSNESCGGVITDQEGQLTTPGYPGRLLPHVRCEWELRAGIGYRYVLSFEFLEDRNGFYRKRFVGETDDGKGCFTELNFFNGKPKHEAINYRNDHSFCDYRKTFVSDADLVTVIYSDTYTNHYNVIMDDFRSDAFYVPFRVNYTKNDTLSFGNYSSTAADGVRYCHAVLRRPDGYATTLVEIAEYNENATIDVPRVVNERFCKASFMNSSKPITHLYLNQDLELHVFNMQSAFMPEEGLSFKLNVQYYKCGGLISEPNSGVITSPNFGDGRPYLSNSHCLWMLVAPEGMIVKYFITQTIVVALFP